MNFWLAKAAPKLGSSVLLLILGIIITILGLRLGLALREEWKK